MVHHGRDIRALAISPNSRRFFTISLDGTAQSWDVLPPAGDEVERLRLSVEVRTGFYADFYGNLQRLEQSEWLRRRRRLWDEFGGPCDVEIGWTSIGRSRLGESETGF